MSRHEKTRQEMNRREALGAIGAVSAMIFVGCGQSGVTGEGGAAGADLASGAATDLGAAGDLASAGDAGALDCVVTPALTEGPFFVDERLARSDLTAGASEPFVTGGLPLALRFGVYNVIGAACTPLPGAQVDVWHASAEGVYSDEASGRIQQKSTVGENYLRGYQLSEQNGAAAFTTIYPGWYTNRTIHIHFKVRVIAGGMTSHEFTSQVLIDDAINDVVLAQAPYNTRGQRMVRNANDNVFGGGAGASYLLDVKPAASGTGYVGRFNIGLQWS